MTEIETLARRFHEDDKRQMREDARAVLATPEGRRLLMAIIGLGGIYAPLGREGDRYDSGRRDAAAELLAFCNSAARELVARASQERTELSMKRELSMNTMRKDDKE